MAGKAIKVKEKGGKMISPDKADIIEVTSQYYGTVFTSPDGKGKSESHSKTLSEKVIKAGKRALPVGDEISDLTDEQLRAIIESRGNPYHDDKGRFTSAGGAGGKMSNVSLPLKPQKIGAKERARLCSQIHSDFPNLPPSDRKYAYENRNHFYLFSVNDYGGNYTFGMKKKLTPENQAKFNAYRRMAENGEI